jgi:hypothetical protein
VITLLDARRIAAIVGTVNGVRVIAVTPEGKGLLMTANFDLGLPPTQEQWCYPDNGAQKEGFLQGCTSRQGRALVNVLTDSGWPWGLVHSRNDRIVWVELRFQSILDGVREQLLAELRRVYGARAGQLDTLFLS